MRVGVLVVAALLVLGVSDALAGPVVYSSLDPSLHTTEPEAGPFLTNALQFAGGGVNPQIGFVTGGLISNNTAFVAGLGFTNITLVSPADLSNPATYAGLDVLYFPLTTSGTSVAAYSAAAADILAFVSGSGGLVVEPNLLTAGSWSWVPDAALIGHSGATNVQGETQVIVDPGHPTMTGLTNAGLSNWAYSVHSTFATPGAAGYSILITDGAGTATTITKTFGAPEPASLLLIGLGAAGVVLVRRRRRS